MLHETLKPGDRCPQCQRGNLYELALPAVTLQLEGRPPVSGTVYECQRLRCSACGAVDTAQPPEGVGEVKESESVIAIVALLKEGCGVPFHRLATFQKNLGIPLAPSTQWELVELGAELLRPLFEALMDCAAQGELFHNDDTTMKILDYLNEGDPDETTRKGIFTSGIVSVWESRKIAIFMTGRRHAGENLTELLRKRAAFLKAPLQMCDALSRNIPSELETIVCHCLVHARRQFVDIIENFPEECAHVIEQLAIVYRHEAFTRQQAMSPEERLAYHRSHSAPVMEELKNWCLAKQQNREVEPNSGLGKAIQYLLKHWKELTRFCHVLSAPLDNNVCERALKHAVLHRKNASFFKTPKGAHVGDLFMSLIHTCERAWESPMEELCAVLKNAARVAKDPMAWMPWNYRHNLTKEPP